MPVVYIPEAREDLLDAWQYIYDRSQSLQIADRLIERIESTAQVYAQQPEIGELRPDLAPRVRCFPVENYVVFYTPLAEGIEVIQVIHGSRDIPRHFRRGRGSKKRQPDSE